jgi:signal-transduction protein with cAMP-binding, CBS, and nucleotidyltransferase domain
LLVMQENSFRHLPVMQDGKHIGIVSARSAIDPNWKSSCLKHIGESASGKNARKER